MLLPIPLAHTDFVGWLRINVCTCRQIRREWLAWTDSRGIQQTEQEAGRRSSALKRRRALRPQGGQHPHYEDWERKAVRFWSLA